MSAKFNNMFMTGGALNFAEGDIHFNNSYKSEIDRGIRHLFSKVAPGAFHDSGERLDPPKCHPNTRVAVIQEILDWLDDLDSSELVMWLNGAAGAGKSAIAQTIAQMLFERGQLSGSFFFARGSTTGRGDERRLVTTLAYQLAKYWPETRAHVAEAVICDPAIFDLTLLSQVQSLLINPLRVASNAIPSSSKAPSYRLFIIDGLDECHDEDAQCRILQVFTDAMKSMQHHPAHKLLITSRSEKHLLAGFNELDTAAVCRRLPLDNSYHPDDDIRLFLQDNFSKIRGEHSMRANGRDLVRFPADEEDPSKEKSIQPKYRRGFSASSNTVNQTEVIATSPTGLKKMGTSPVQVVLTSPGVPRPDPSLLPQSGHPQHSASSVLTADKTHPHGQPRIHHGAVDQTTVTTLPPREVMAHIKKVLEGMGIEIQLESEYKYRCIRAKKKKNTVGSSTAAAGGNSTSPSASLAAVTMVGNAASNEVGKRYRFLRLRPSPELAVCYVRQSSQVPNRINHGPSSSQPSLTFDDEISVVVSEPLMQDIVFGDPTQDAGDEVRFSVELTRLDRLNDTFSLDIRRLKGNLRSYKFLYDTLREMCFA